ncbi:NTP transferase domain-containing protein [Polynucleobacter paneuropaeus]|nr:NTP transferase domain-containing protein [Polynucleobacter paneuropaeus]
MLPIAILAGGLATRLRPVTQTIPKALIEVTGRPFIEHQLEYLKGQGISSVVLCIGHLGQMIQDLVEDGAHWGLNVQYSIDGSPLLGTGGAIKKALPLLGNQFFVLYGDSYLPINFQSVQNFFIESGRLGLMTILENQNRWDRSNVRFERGELLEYNKELVSQDMHYIDYGLGVLNSEVFDSYSTNQSFDLSKVYNELSLKKQLVGFEVFQRFYEIGSRQGIEDTQKYLLQKMRDKNT